MPLIVVNELGSNLFGLDWSDAFGLTEEGISAVKSVDIDPTPSLNSLQKEVNLLNGKQFSELKKKFNDVFSGKLGKCKQLKANVHLKPEAKPVFHKPRPLPFAIRQKVKNELDSLETRGVLKRVNFSPWAAPIVVVNKSNGSIRICGDFKGLNRNIDVDQHPIPTLDSLLEKHQGGKFYSKIDLADAYLQIELDDESKKFCVVNTPFGLYQYNRMCFDIASSPAQFQRCMDSMIIDLPGTVAYLDDIIVTGKSEEEHWFNLQNVLQRLSDYGFSIKESKCEFFKTSVEYLGHVIDEKGKHPSNSAIEAIKLLKKPENVQEVQAFLEKINYYVRFIQNLSEKASPLYFLLKKSSKFKWTNDCQAAFEKLKTDVISATKLSHYNETKPLILATDASQRGIGAVLMQKQNDEERPIAHASKTLSSTQQRYSQIEREALSIIYGVKKFHQYLYGRKFTLITDHKPLVSIFSPNKNLLTMTVQRLQRYALTLMAYQFDIQYKKTSEHGNADGLSRLTTSSDSKFDEFETRESIKISCSIDIAMDGLPLSRETICEETQRDSTLKTVISCVERSNWSKIAKNSDLLPFKKNKDSLSVDENVLLLHRDGLSRVVIPSVLQPKVLQLLHEAHWGISRMKQMARRYVWWPKINSDIESMVQCCSTCRTVAKAPDQKYQPWPKTEKPWERIHLDYAGPFFGKMWFICVDAHSNYKRSNAKCRSNNCQRNN